LSTSTTSSSDSDGSLRRLSTYSGLTSGSTSSSSYTEPLTPFEGSFAGVQAGKHSDQVARERKTSETSAFSVSAYYGSSDCSEEVPIQAFNALLAPIDICNKEQQLSQPPSPFITTVPAVTTTPPNNNTPTQPVTVTPQKSLDNTPLPRKLKSKQRKLFGNEYRWPSPGESSGASIHPVEPSCPPNATLDKACSDSIGPIDFNVAQSYQKLEFATPFRPSVPTGLDQRRGSPPHAPLLVVPLVRKDSRMSDIESARPAFANSTVAPLVERSSLQPSLLSSSSPTMCQVLHPPSVSPSALSGPFTAVSQPDGLQHSRPTTTASQYTFPSSKKNIIDEQDGAELPVGELFRTLQIWFDQEGFREIAPIFSFSGYHQDDDLLYFTTERVGYPFHYTSFQQLPALRKVVAPDYEEAYALLEGKTSRNAAGRRDFLSRQASLDMKTPGKYMVEDTEGKGGKWIWRLVYEVEERKSLMGKPMPGERAFIPITFACSPEVLDPSHARKPSLMNTIMKNMGSKKAALPLDAEGRPKPRPRGKSLMGQRRDRSDSTARLIGTSPRYVPSSNSPNHDPIPSPQTPQSTKSSTGTLNGDELSHAQAHFFKTISPASSSRLRPNTAQADDSRRLLRRHKTSEHLRRPMTADPFAPPLPSRPTAVITPLFGIAPQPTRETPNTLGSRFLHRPKTADQRRPHTPKARLDIHRIAAASLFTPVDARY
ncbi:hypothetical protein CROQUDRAFT_35535, partial [Cronartium quercuum f. sp. fusiforme G11]